MTDHLDLPNVTRNLGDGVGLRSAHFRHLVCTPAQEWGVDWFEVTTENFLDASRRTLTVLDYVAAQRPIAMHGVSLNIGGTDPLDTSYLRKLGMLADRIHPVWVSDHLCWTGVDGHTSHDLLPLPLTREVLTHVSERVHQVQDYLGRPLVLENPSTYLEFTSSDIPEWEFLTELAHTTGCGLLLDVNNVYVSAVNHGGYDPATYIRGLPANRIAYLHLAGHTQPTGTYLLDTHDRPVAAPVWGLYALAQQHTGGASTLLEWDSDIPEFGALLAELAKAKAVRVAQCGDLPTVGNSLELATP